LNIRKKKAVRKIEEWWLNKMYEPNSVYVQTVLKDRFEKQLVQITKNN